MRAFGVWGQFNGDDGFRTFGSTCACDPCNFDKLIGFEAEEAPIMRMALVLVDSFKEKGRVDFGCHQDRTGLINPADRSLMFVLA